MATLLEKIQSNLQNLTTSPSGGGGVGTGMSDSTQSAARLLAARSGKAVGTPAPLSNIGEQVTLGTTNQQLGQVQQAANTQAAQLGQAGTQQEQTFNTAQADMNLHRQQQEQQYRIQTGNLLAELERDRGSLDMDKKKFGMEQVASSMALQDRQYTDTLQREGARKRLQDSIRFEEELAKSVMADNYNILKAKLGKQNVLSANDRDFQRAMGRMNVGEALAIARGNAAAARAAGMASGLGGMASGAASAYKPAETPAPLAHKTPTVLPASNTGGGVTAPSSREVLS